MLGANAINLAVDIDESTLTDEPRKGKFYILSHDVTGAGAGMTAYLVGASTGAIISTAAVATIASSGSPIQQAHLHDRQ